MAGIRETKQTFFEPINVPVDDDGNASDYVSTTPTQCSIYQHMYQLITMVLHVAMLVPRTPQKFKPINIPVNGTIRGYVLATDTMFKPINVPVKKMMVIYVAMLTDIAYRTWDDLGLSSRLFLE